MKNKHIYINVYLQSKEFVPAGVITFNEEQGHSSFSYFDSYINENLPPLNPATLNWKEHKEKHFTVDPNINSQMLDKTFWEMLPTEEDWGHIVLAKRYPEYETFNNAQKLFFLEKRVVGGLDAYLNETSKEDNIVGVNWLDQVRDESIDFYMQRIANISHIKAINPLSSYGGVRPKCMFEDDDGEFWIAKFNLPTDDYDMALAEQVALDISRDIGLTCAESKVIQLPSGENVFLSKRFDRIGDKKFHSLSLYALNPEEKIKNKKGEFIHTLIKQYSDFENQDSLNIVLKMLLDIGINNTDNHLRNFRIILNENDKWQLSPFYDINFSMLNSNHSYSPVDLEKIYLANPELAEVMSKNYGVPINFIDEKINKIFSVLENWESYCDKHNMTTEDKLKIGNAIMIGLYKKNIKNSNNVSSINKLINLPKLVPKYN